MYITLAQVPRDNLTGSNHECSFLSSDIYNPYRKPVHLGHEMPCSIWYVVPSTPVFPRLEKSCQSTFRTVLMRPALPRGTWVSARLRRGHEVISGKWLPGGYLVLISYSCSWSCYSINSQKDWWESLWPNDARSTSSIKKRVTYSDPQEWMMIADPEEGFSIGFEGQNMPSSDNGTANVTVDTTRAFTSLWRPFQVVKYIGTGSNISFSLQSRTG